MSDRGQPILELREVSKTFGRTQVLHDVSLEVRAGEVHALAGENGSGKSTLIKILAGYHHPDGHPEILVNGRRLATPVRPAAAAAAGIAFLHQDLALVGSMSVAENILIGRGFDTSLAWRVRWRRERRAVTALLREFDLPVDPDAPVESLSEVDRAIVAIIRAIEQLKSSGEGGVMVLDEPTTFLPRREVSRVFAAIRTAVERGAGVIFISHSLDEIREISDRVTVLRDGRVVGTVATAEVDERAIVRMLVGRDLDDLYPAEGESARHDVVMRVRDLRGGEVQGVDFELRQGEILGVTGLLGMGHDELPYLLAGARHAEGSIEVRGEAVRLGSVRAALAAGVALLPADRKQESSLQSATVGENVTLPVLGDYWRGGRLRHRAERRAAAELLREYDVRPPLPGRVLSSLSGGNQQKALLAKWMQLGPPVLVLHEPVQGVDIGARSQIFAFMRKAADEGKAIVLCSSEYENLTHLSDRILVLREGRVVGELRGANLSEDAILSSLYLQPAAPS